MKKSSFAALILGTVSGMLFAVGMCMALIPEWDAFLPGLVFGGVGILLALVTAIVWRRMTGKAPVHISGKAILSTLVGIVGALLLGVGMCFCMVWDKLLIGIPVGILGIAVLLGLIPLIGGLHD